MRAASLSCLLLFSLAAPAQAQNTTTPGELRSHATLHSIGIEWDIGGDANHDAECTVHYRVSGAGAWKQAYLNPCCLMAANKL